MTQNSGFMEWIVRSVSKENVQDKLCKCGVSLSNMGEKALHSHAAGKRRKKRFIGVLLFVYFYCKVCEGNFWCNFAVRSL